jgi:hypothetical protein
VARERCIDLVLARPRSREVEQQPEHHRDGEDDRAGAPKEYPRALEEAERKVLDRGQLVLRQLHDEPARRAARHRTPQNQSDDHRADDPE